MSLLALPCFNMLIILRETSDLEVIQSSQMKLLIEQRAKWIALIDDHRKEEKELREKHFKVSTIYDSPVINLIISVKEFVGAEYFFPFIFNKL